MLRPAAALLMLGLLVGPQKSLAPYVPTPPDVVDRMLEFAAVTRTDVVYDLGCGDGRIPIAAAKTYGARGVGIDIDPRRIQESRANAAAAGVEHLVEFRLADVMQSDVRPATVVTLYLLGSSNALLRPMLTSQLRPGARIVSHAFSMGPEWPADKVDRLTTATGDEVTLYLWILPKVPRVPKAPELDRRNFGISGNFGNFGNAEFSYIWQLPVRRSPR